MLAQLSAAYSPSKSSPPSPSPSPPSPSLSPPSPSPLPLSKAVGFGKNNRHLANRQVALPGDSCPGTFRGWRRGGDASNNKDSEDDMAEPLMLAAQAAAAKKRKKKSKLSLMAGHLYDFDWISIS
ncbi:hypothetical protein GGX14DRAFT_387399 [Mycena pura]|uniref:Uncharacterized protein n=1 Tax=Mycena pura TaxID=153505 RepID=A0AAD7E1T2_9AGAR|nr:hypothetical protein GGX14DRAFT_387399 [Mycena pura]